jgi:hypothetical protein
LTGGGRRVYDIVEPMAPLRLRRVLAAAALAAYAVAALLLLPLHGGEAAGSPPDGTPGVRAEATCPGGDCHDPEHGHREGHAHDPATCVSCAQVRAAAAPPSAGPVLDPAGRAAGVVPAAARRAPPAAPGAPFPARGPPALPA